MGGNVRSRQMAGSWSRGYHSHYRIRADIPAAFLADSCSLLKEGANVDVKAWVFLELCSAFLQLVFFIPFYLIWRKDCKEIGKENLAVSLKDRFIAWCLWFPFWLFPILILDS